MKLTILGLGTMTGAILAGALDAGAVRAEDVTATIIAGEWIRRDDATAEDLRHVLNELRGRDS